MSNFDKNKLPEWKKEGISPPEEKREEKGWEEGDKPPAEWFNWFWNKAYKALYDLFDKAETTEGAQDKADTAEQNATDYTDSHKANYTPHLLENKEENREEYFGWQITEDGHLALIREVKE